MLNSIPGMTVLEARDMNELRAMLRWSADFDAPCAIRYIKEGLVLSREASCSAFTLAQWETMREGSEAVLLAHGRMVSHALRAAELLQSQGISCSVVNASTLKPLDVNMLDRLWANPMPMFIIEENVAAASLGEAVMRYLHEKHCNTMPIEHICLPDSFVTHGSMDILLNECGLMPDQIAARVFRALKE
jgi:1-deoxy-D-xylulose-5-phosphate synthase